MDHQAPLFTRLIPILFVRHLRSEREFYVRLGFSVTYAGPEYPDFVALESGSITFGIERKDGFRTEFADRVLVWQIGVDDVDAVKERLTAAAVPFREEWMTPREDWRYRVLHCRTPNGYKLLLEGQKRE